MHLHQLEESITHALLKPGFSFIEVISPCPTVYGRMNKEPDGLDSLRNYVKRSIIKNGADLKETEINVDGPLIVGNFVDIVKPTLQDNLNALVTKIKKPTKN